MGLFDKAREKRKIRKTFEKYVSPEVIKLIEATPAAQQIGPPEHKHFQFVVIHVDERDLNRLSATAGKVSDTLYEHKAVITTAMPPVIVATLGWMFAEDSPEGRKVLVGELLAENQNAIRIAHGQCEGLVGNFGGAKRFSWGAVVPGYAEILKKLLDTPFGQAIEIS